MENINAVTGKEVCKYISEEEITCSDFNQSKRLIAIGCKTGSFILLDSGSLSLLKDLLPGINTPNAPQLSITAISCVPKDYIIVGYSNGVGKKYIYGGEGEAECFMPNLALSPQTSMYMQKVQGNKSEEVGVEEAEHTEELDRNIGAMDKDINILYPSVKHISISEAENRVILGYEKDLIDENKTTTELEHPYIFFYSTETGILNGEISTSGSSDIYSMDIIPKKQLLITLSKGNLLRIFHMQELTLMMQFSASLPGICENNSILSMRILPITPRLTNIYTQGDMSISTPKQIYPPPENSNSNSNEHREGDVLFLGLDNGNILSSTLLLTEVDDKLRMQWLPVNLYTSGGGKYGTPNTPDKATHRILRIWVDPLIDVLITGDQFCGIRLFEKIVSNFFYPEQKKGAAKGVFSSLFTSKKTTPNITNKYANSSNVVNESLGGESEIKYEHREIEIDGDLEGNKSDEEVEEGVIGHKGEEIKVIDPAINTDPDIENPTDPDIENPTDPDIEINLE